MGGLTLLAGDNSSGKSSLMQPLLLLKQTLDANYDPGPLLLHGPHVRFTASTQFFSQRSGREVSKTASFDLHTNQDERIGVTFSVDSSDRLKLKEYRWKERDSSGALRVGMKSGEVSSLVPKVFKEVPFVGPSERGKTRWSLERNRCYFEIQGSISRPRKKEEVRWSVPPLGMFVHHLVGNVIHLPGLRGYPELSYPITGAGSRFAGPFPPYTASVIASWEESGESKRLAALFQDLRTLGLTWKVVTKRLSETQVEIRVWRLQEPSKRGAGELINIAHSGLGISQTLPILVALQAAGPTNLVYIEQPEIHLHPDAQMAFAKVLAAAVRRGVRMVIETHSALLLLGIQTAVAKKDIESEHVKLYWFSRNKNGMTRIDSGLLDKGGAFGKWPETFGRAELRAQREFLLAAKK